jgi:hypothetical protein
MAMYKLPNKYLSGKNHLKVNTVKINLMTTHSTLKSRQRKERHQYGEYLSVRVHRALSWLDMAD